MRLNQIDCSIVFPLRAATVRQWVSSSYSILFSNSILLSAFLGWTLVACTSPDVGNLALRSQANPNIELIGGFDSSYYSLDDHNNVTLVLLDGPADKPVQAVVIRMFWKPRPGRTPIDATATNATIRYTIFTGPDDQDAGIYSGAGFVYPIDEPGFETFTADVWQATLQLTDRSAGFKDLLGQALLEGRLTATRDDAVVSRVLHMLHLMLTQRIGYPKQM